MVALRRLAALVVGILVGCGACVLDGLTADLDGPRVVASSLAGPRTIELPVVEPIVVEFSEPLDPASVTPGAVVVVPWGEVGSCALTPECPEGSCERGRCMVDPLREGDLRAIDRGEFAAALGLRWTLTAAAAGPGTRLEILPEVAYAPRWRHSLVLGAGLRDRSGAPLLDGAGARGRFRRDFVTATEGSSGPEARLHVPAVGELVPRNLSTVTTAFVRPVAEELDGATIDLLGDDGSSAALVDPEPCPGWVPGFCLRWRVAGPLAAGVVYRLAGGALVDPHGRPAKPPHDLQWFAVGDAEDRLAPDPTAAVVELRGRCVVARVSASEPMTVRLRVSGEEAIVSDAATDGSDVLEVAVSLRTWPEGGAASLSAAIELEDRAGNVATDERVLVLAATEPPPIALVEVLANPAGPEPAQEFVELLDVRAAGSARTIDGLRIVDRSWSEVAAAIAEGDLPGAEIPSFASEPGQRTVIVGDAYALGDPGDPDPPVGAALVTLDGSIGAGGLSNGGEPLTIYDPETAARVASYATPLASDGQGRSAVNDHPGACDIAGAWRPHPLGASSPGWSP